MAALTQLVVNLPQARAYFQLQQKLQHGSAPSPSAGEAAGRELVSAAASALSTHPTFLSAVSDACNPDVQVGRACMHGPMYAYMPAPSSSSHAL